MSGIYIPGMEMPERCFDCDLCYDMYRCRPLGVDYYETDGFDPSDERLPNCPLVSVPDHGRLIDGDALSEEHRKRAYATNGGSYQFHITAKAWVDEAPTIIPASGGDAE